MTNTMQEVVDFLDGMQQGVSLSALMASLSHIDAQDLKDATRQLYEDRCINRLSVKGDNGRFYYVFFSLYIRTTTIHRDSAYAPAPAPEVAPVPEPDRGPLITIEEAEDVLRQAGWAPEGETVDVLTDIDALRVIDCWNLPYRLSRVIEIIGGARQSDLTGDDIARAVTLLQGHVKEVA